MNLTDEERATVIAQLRERAIREMRKLGCTCRPEPRMELTDTLHGPHRLPMWTSDHPDDCPVSLLARAAWPGAERVLLYDPKQGRP